ncbi:MAG: CTP synthase (glutamine hydrolyzing) [Phycisphaerales bacterium]|nr:MAG: CTP synthase (glutamine hydrolyzing) [Phycisphaerales bacterium]
MPTLPTFPSDSSPRLLHPTAGSEPLGADLSRFGKSVRSTEFFSPVPKGYQRGGHNYVAVFGTVMSGLGKGIFSSSLAKLMKDKGLAVAPIKLEGYLNIDSGTLNPYRHGEVFVLDDGTECDMDLGTYERMLDQNLSRQNFVTSGQVYTTILDRERKGEYLGRDVQMIPHVTGEVKYRLRKLAMTGGPSGGPADVVFVEVGGTVGDYENGFYIEALRELAFEEGPHSTCFVALTYILEPATLGEQKSKAAQLGIKRLMEAGVQPTLVACRAQNEVTETVRQKIAMFSNVPIQRVFSMHDRESIYTIPEAMRAEGLDREILSILDLHGKASSFHEDHARARWREFTGKLLAPRKHQVRLGILGKYTALRDAYASIDKAIEHASAHLSANVDVQWIDTTDINDGNVAEHIDESINAIIVPGGFGDRGAEGKIACVNYVRENRIPFLGICLGFQMAVIDYARHVLNMAGANSTEFDGDCAEPVISELPEQKKIEGLGGTMRLGAQDVLIEPDTLAATLFDNRRHIRERFRHRFEVDPQYIDRLAEAGMIFSGRHPDHPIMQVLELPLTAHPYFIAAQFHPELTSRPLSPQPMFMGLVASAIAHAYPDLAGGSIPARWLPPRSPSAPPPQIPPGSVPPSNPTEAAGQPPAAAHTAPPAVPAGPSH